METKDDMATTGQRFNGGKPVLSMVLEAPHALEGAAQVLMFGEQKYARSNWKKGLKYTEIADSLLRHLTKYLNGEELDLNDEGQADKNHSGLPHVDHILVNAMFLSEMTRIHPELDDRPALQES